MKTLSPMKLRIMVQAFKIRIKNGETFEEIAEDYPRLTVDDLEKIRPYEPNVVKAAWSIFGKSYEYRAKYNAYKKARMDAERKKGSGSLMDGQMRMDSI